MNTRLANGSHRTKGHRRSDPSGSSWSVVSCEANSRDASSSHVRLNPHSLNQHSLNQHGLNHHSLEIQTATSHRFNTLLRLLLSFILVNSFPNPSLALPQQDVNPKAQPRTSVEAALTALGALDHECDKALSQLEEDLQALRSNPEYLTRREARDWTAITRMRQEFIQPYLEKWIPRYDALSQSFEDSPGEIFIAASRLERQVTWQPAELMESVVLRHAASPHLGPIARRLPWAYRRLGASRYFAMISKVLGANADPQIQAYALYARAMPTFYDENASPEKKTSAQRDMLRVKNLVAPESLLWKRAHGPEFQETRLQVGMAVPEIEGVDLDGRPMQLSEYRGKVQVVVFWGDWCRSCRTLYEQKRSLVRRMEGRPFALIGINSDPDLERVQSVVEDEGINWRSFWNGEEGAGGPLSSLWNVTRWPTIYVVDHHGKIRDLNKRGEELDQLIDQLVADAEKE